MKINYNVSSNNFKAKDYNVDTIYIRYDEKYYKILDPETREKKEISKEDFSKLDASEREVNYTEKQYTYKEYVELLQEENETLSQALIELVIESENKSMENDLALAELTMMIGGMM